MCCCVLFVLWLVVVVACGLWPIGCRRSPPSYLYQLEAGRMMVITGPGRSEKNRTAEGGRPDGWTADGEWRREGNFVYYPIVELLTCTQHQATGPCTQRRAQLRWQTLKAATQI